MRIFGLIFGFMNCLSLAFADAGDDFIRYGKIFSELKTLEYLPLVARFLPTNPNILEAGAHKGEDTVLLAKHWERGFVFAFEPVPKFFSNIEQNVKKHKVSNVKAFPIGLFSSSGDHTFYYSLQCDAASSFLPDNGVVAYNDITMTLPCKNLDEWAVENSVDHIDFMWLDMEGAEYYMLSSAPKILKTTKVILTEINFREFRKGSTQYDILKNYLESQGFVLHMIWGSPLWQATGLFVKAELIR